MCDASSTGSLMESSKAVSTYIPAHHSHDNAHSMSTNLWIRTLRNTGPWGTAAAETYGCGTGQSSNRQAPGTAPHARWRVSLAVAVAQVSLCDSLTWVASRWELPVWLDRLGC